MILIGILVAAVTVASVVLSAEGVIPRNPIVGIRIRETLANDPAWFAGHRAAILPTVVAASAVIAIGAAATLFGLSDSPLPLGAMALSLLSGAGVGVTAARRAARCATDQSTKRCARE